MAQGKLAHSKLVLDTEVGMVQHKQEVGSSEGLEGNKLGLEVGSKLAEALGSKQVAGSKPAEELGSKLGRGSKLERGSKLVSFCNGTTVHLRYPR